MLYYCCIVGARTRAQVHWNKGGEGTDEGKVRGAPCVGLFVLKAVATHPCAHAAPQSGQLVCCRRHARGRLAVLVTRAYVHVRVRRGSAVSHEVGQSDGAQASVKRESRVAKPARACRFYIYMRKVQGWMEPP